MSIIMKNKNIYNVSVLIVCLFTSCHCKTCTDNLSEANKKVIYTNNQLVVFKNDTLGLSYDTIKVMLHKPSSSSYDCLGSSGDVEATYCSSYSEIEYSNHFYMQISQLSNKYNNEIAYYTSNIDGEIRDTVQFNYKNTIYKAIHYYYQVDSLGSYLWNYYKQNKFDSTFVINDYYYTVDKSIMLLQYTKIFKDGKRRVYRLQ